MLGARSLDHSAPNWALELIPRVATDLHFATLLSPVGLAHPQTRAGNCSQEVGLLVSVCVPDWNRDTVHMLRAAKHAHEVRCLEAERSIQRQLGR